VIHVADATGLAVQNTLTSKVRQHPNITVLEQHIAIDLITGDKLGLGDGAATAPMCSTTASGEVLTLGARHTLIATGGAGKVYLYTTNPDTSTGDGIAMAWRAGCRVANMEFIQFHPTCLYHPEAKSFLISEAVRGEGGLLLLPDGTRFMPWHDARAELAPRDVVARAIDFEMKKRGLDCVYLDISHKPADFIGEHFPNIWPAASNWASTSPASRFRSFQPRTTPAAASSPTCARAPMSPASTSLVKPRAPACTAPIAWPAIRCSNAWFLPKRRPMTFLNSLNADFPSLPPWDESRVSDPDEEIVIAHNWDELRRFMWDYVGIVRTTKRLQRAQNRIRLLIREIDDFYSHFRVSHDLIELRNLVVTADLIIRCALRRHESRGCTSAAIIRRRWRARATRCSDAACGLIASDPHANAATDAAGETAPAGMLSGNSTSWTTDPSLSCRVRTTTNWLNTAVSGCTARRKWLTIGRIRSVSSPLTARRRPTTFDGAIPACHQRQRSGASSSPWRVAGGQGKTHRQPPARTCSKTIRTNRRRERRSDRDRELHSGNPAAADRARPPREGCQDLDPLEGHGGVGTAEAEGVRNPDVDLHLTRLHWRNSRDRRTRPD
jgi:L-aspartate oxidase